MSAIILFSLKSCFSSLRVSTAVVIDDLQEICIGNFCECCLCRRNNVLALVMVVWMNGRMDGWICMYSKKRMFDILFQSIRVRRKRVLTFILYVKMNSNKKEKNHSTAVKLDVLEYNTILV